MSKEPPIFLCDHMLGSLAKWLRLLGYDTLYPGPIGDRELAEMAYDETRTLLTRDKDLGSRVKGAIYISRDELGEQLGFVVTRLGLDLSDTLSLCSVCNVPIKEVEKESVRAKVPPAVLELQDKFWMCPSCGRLYWQGSHWENIRSRIREMEGRFR